MSDTQVEAIKRALAPRLEHGRLIQDKAMSLGRRYEELEREMYGVRRELLYLLPELERYGRILDGAIGTIRKFIALADEQKREPHPRASD